MLLRSILELLSRRAVRRIPRHITSQTPTLFRRDLSTKPPKNASSQPNDSGEAPESGGSVSKLIFGSAAVGAAIFAAYQTGYLDQVLGGKDQHDSLKVCKGPIESRDVKDIQQFEGHSVLTESKEANKVASSADEKVEKIEILPDQPRIEDLTEKQDEVQSQSQAQDKSDVTPDEGTIPINEKDLPEDSQSGTISDDQSTISGVQSEGVVDIKIAEENTDKGSNEEVQTSPIFTQTNEAEKEPEAKVVPPVHVAIEEKEVGFGFS